MYTGYYMQNDYIYGPELSGRFYIQNGYIYGPVNSGRYYIQDGYIYGPKDAGKFYIQDNYMGVALLGRQENAINRANRRTDDQPGVSPMW